MQKIKKVQQVVDVVRSLAAPCFQPRIGIVYGTGYGGLEEQLEDCLRIPYAELPEFPRATVSGHQGELCGGMLGGTPVWLLAGRVHLYEGYSSAEVCMGVRTLAGLGVRQLIVTNAAGALHPQFEVGSVMCITDQINLTGAGPLADEVAGGCRFTDMSEAYSPELQDLARTLAVALRIPLERGVYAGVCAGRSTRLRLRTRMLRVLGGGCRGHVHCAGNHRGQAAGAGRAGVFLPGEQKSSRLYETGDARRGCCNRQQGVRAIEPTYF